MHTSTLARWRNRQPGDLVEDHGKQPPWHGYLGELERDILRMLGDFGSNLHEFFSQRRQRPVLDIPGQCQPPQEVRQVVRQHKQLQSRLIVFERAAGNFRPFDGVLD